jgi:hypothetical protein
VITKLAALAAVFAVGVVLSATPHAQRGRGARGEKPKVDIVQTVGCADRKDGSPEIWLLTRAAEPEVAPAGLLNVKQVEAAKTAALGTNVFQLVGVADFLDTEGLLRSGPRKEFTTPETANATGDLRPGRKVLVKGMLIDTLDPKRINLLAVVGLADTCR